MGKVFLDHDPKSLDDAYDQAVYAPNREIVIGRWHANGELVRFRLGDATRLTYGPTKNNQLDLYHARRACATRNFAYSGRAVLRQMGPA